MDETFRADIAGGYAFDGPSLLLGRPLLGDRTLESKGV